MKMVTLFFLCLPVYLTAQVVVKGIITEQNSGNRPVPGVQVIVLGTNPQVSDDSGYFQITFTTKKPGDRLIVTEISKKGYEIVNKNEIFENWVIPSATHYRIKIIMCPDGQLAQNKLQYYNISLQALTKGYTERIRELEKQRDQQLITVELFHQNYLLLEEQFKNQQKQLEELADKFAHENFDDCSTIHKKAFETFKEGKIEEAIRILESVNSEEEITKAKEQKNKGELLIMAGVELQSESDSVIHNLKLIKDQNILYGNAVLQTDRKKQYLDKILGDTTNPSFLLSYAYYLDSLGEYNESVKWFTKSLGYTIEDTAQTLITLDKLAYTLFVLKQYDSSIDTYLKCIQINTSLDKTGPESHKSSIARSYGYISKNQLFKQQFSMAEKSARKGITIDKTQQWIKVHLIIALLYQNKYKKAKKLFIEFKDKPSPTDNSKTFLYDYTKELNNLKDQGINNPGAFKLLEEPNTL